MTSSPFKKTTAYFTSHCRDLEFIFTKTKKLAALNECFTKHIDPPIRDHCQVANITDKCLIVIVTNGSVATQLRFMTADLLQKIKQQPLLNTIQTIQFKVRPFLSSTTKQQPRKNTPRLSKNAANIVQEIAYSIQDPVLQAIMLRIAKRVD